MIRQLMLLGCFTLTSTFTQAGWLTKAIDKWNSSSDLNENIFVQHPTVQEYFHDKFKSPRQIALNNVSYKAGVVMYERAQQYCEKDLGQLVQIEQHPKSLYPYRGAEILDTPNLQKYYGLFECQNIANPWKVYFDHQNQRIIQSLTPILSVDVSYVFE